MLYQDQDGQKGVIAYASRSVSKSERNYPVHKLEFLALKWAITDKFHEYLYGAEFQVFTDNNPLTYVLTTAKLDATGHRWVAALSNYTFNILYKPGKANRDADALSRIKWPEAVEITPQSVHTVHEGVQAPHGKIKTICYGAQAVGVLNQDNMPPGMMPLEWSQAQSKDPVLCQIIEANQHRTLGKLKIKKDMPSDLKEFLRIRKQLKLKQGILYRKLQVSNNSRAKLQLVLPIEYGGRWKSQSDVAPLLNIEATQPLELIHLDYLQIEPSKGNIENVLILQTILPGMPMHTPQKHRLL